MIGRVLCVFGHVGQEDGGTVTYDCPRCHRTRRQRWARPVNMAAVDRHALTMIDAGHPEAAARYVRQEVRRALGIDTP